MASLCLLSLSIFVKQKLRNGRVHPCVLSPQRRARRRRTLLAERTRRSGACFTLCCPAVLCTCQEGPMLSFLQQQEQSHQLPLFSSQIPGTEKLVGPAQSAQQV